MTSERHGPRRTSLHAAARELAELEAGLDPLRVAARLRGRLPPEVARFAAELYGQRKRAAGRFPAAERAFFTRKGLEQATRAPVARARAATVAAVASSARVLDATCGIGADTLALASAGLDVVAADRDARHALFTSENLRAAGLPDRVVVAEAAHPAVAADVLVLDPDRRATGERGFAPDSWSPPLSEAVELSRRYRGACIKLPPAVEADRIRALIPAELPYRLQWVSSDRELCEVALWMGTLAGERLAAGEHDVLALTTRGHLPEQRLSGRPASVVFLPPEKVSAISWLAEPDPAVIRAGLVGVLARRLGLAPIGPGIAWLGGTRRPEPFLVRTWSVVEVAPADPRRVRAMLGRHDVGPIQVLKRGHPDTPEVLERRFRGPGARRATLAVARLERGHAALLLEEPSGGGEARGGLVGDEGFEPPTSSL